ncbi:MAG: DUF4405 domain-containing protein [Pyrobaculum sp.]
MWQFVDEAVDRSRTNTHSGYSPQVSYIRDVFTYEKGYFVLYHRRGDDAVSGLVRYFFLPSGVKKGGQAVFLGLTKDTWTTIHEWSGFILLGLAAAHVALHFNWYQYD